MKEIKYKRKGRAMDTKKIKEVREKTGVSMIVARQALEKCNWDVEIAYEWIMWHGLPVNIKKGRSDKND